MCEQKFFICRHCGNIVGRIAGTVPMVCCGEKMEELVANTVEASSEKHIPAVQIEGDRVHVQIGSVIHPMAAEHHIEWIYLQTEHGGQRKCLTVGGEPKTDFAVVNDKPVAVFAYCNLHGLWKIEL